MTPPPPSHAFKGNAATASAALKRSTSGYRAAGWSWSVRTTGWPVPAALTASATMQHTCQTMMPLSHNTNATPKLRDVAQLAAGSCHGCHPDSLRGTASHTCFHSLTSQALAAGPSPCLPHKGLPRGLGQFQHLGGRKLQRPQQSCQHRHLPTCSGHQRTQRRCLPTEHLCSTSSNSQELLVHSTQTFRKVVIPSASCA